jgi:peptidoglycan/xylan/chitin deacetylase (PgdA/CDA1 family)
VVVLLYHRIGRRSTLSVDLPTWLFAEQMARLAESGRVIDLDTALARLKEPSPGGPDPVVVTFDDGTADFAEVALPVLQAHRVPACLYVATDYVDRQRGFPACGAPMSWAALADTVSTGLVTIGSHTHTHALLDRLDAGLVADELDRSIGLIGDALGAPPDHFAYPKAVPGSVQAEAAVRERFVSAALAGTRSNPYQATDAYRLARSPIQVEDGLGWFAHKAAGGMRLEDELRRLANRWRYAGAVS